VGGVVFTTSREFREHQGSRELGWMSRLFDMGLCEPMRKMQTNMEVILHVKTKFIIIHADYFRYVIVEVNRNRLHHSFAMVRRDLQSHESKQGC
jgi:hypothetical protein